VDVVDLYLFSKSSMPHHVQCRPLPRSVQIMIDNRDMDRVYNVSLDVAFSCSYVTHNV